MKNKIKAIAKFVKLSAPAYLLSAAGGYGAGVVIRDAETKVGKALGFALAMATCASSYYVAKNYVMSEELDEEFDEIYDLWHS